MQIKWINLSVLFEVHKNEKIMEYTFILYLKSFIIVIKHSVIIVLKYSYVIHQIRKKL